MKKTATLAHFVFILAIGISFPICVSAAPGDILFQDDFEAGTSVGNYTVVTDPDPLSFGGAPLTGDSIDFAFDYVSLGDASDVRSGRGALVETVGAITAFVNGLNIDGSVPVSIKYDLFHQWNSGGSTEYATVGVGNGTDPFENWLRGSINGTELTQGVFALITSDADTGGAGDYLISESAGGINEPTNLIDLDAAAATQGGTGFGTVFPGDGGDWKEATPGYHWTTVEMIIDGNDVTLSFDGFEIATVTSSVSATGFVGFGANDPFPSTNNSPATVSIIDNIVITEIPEPSTLGLLSLSGMAFLLRRRKN